MPWLPAGLEAARMMLKGIDFEGCLLALVVAATARVSVATLESRARRVQSGCSFGQLPVKLTL